MKDTIPRDRTATAAERADEAARMERARAGQLRPRTLHAMCEQAARLVPCKQCERRPGTECPGGDYHLARFIRAYVTHLITPAEMAAVLDAAGDVFANGTIIRDGDAGG